MDLNAPIRFRSGAESKNGLALAPLTNQQSHTDGTLSEAEHDWLVRRARGGFGIITTCAAHISADAQGFDGQLGFCGPEHLHGLTRLASSIRSEGALSLGQLYHGGVRSPSRLTGQQPWSASAFTEPRPDFEAPRAATEEDLARVIGQFADAARLAEVAGFDGVELHGAHGYLLSQFLSAVMNTREDGWGGSIAARARLIREVTRAVRAAVRPDFIVGVRLSLEDMGFVRGLDLDESLQVAAWLAEDGVDFIHASLWDASKPTQKRPEEHPLPLLRAALPADVKIVVAGNLWSTADLEHVNALGADIAAVGRAAIIDPDWAKSVARDGHPPKRAPARPLALLDAAVSASFVSYLRRFPGLVVEEGKAEAAVSFPSAAPDREVQAFLALPLEAHAPAVLLCHEWWGLNDDMRGLARRFAAAGFIALAVDLYQGHVTEVSEEAAALSQALQTPTAMEDLRGAVAFLRARPELRGGIGVTGFCLGGAIALAAACNVDGLAAAAPFYGLPKAEHADWSRVKIPIQGHYAKQDGHVTPERVSATWAAMAAAGVHAERFDYDAGHAFMRAGDPKAFEGRSANQAWKRVTAFFAANLRAQRSR